MKKYFITAAAAAALLGQVLSIPAMAAPQGRQATPLAGAVAETPDEYVFRYGGKSFAMLDTETKDSKKYFFVLCDDLYGSHKYDSSPKRNNDTCLAYWEPEDPYNMAYWLNHDFLENGNGAGNKLPDGIVSYIDNEHEWTTEELKGLEGYDEAPKKTVHPLALLSVTEWRDKYIKKIGQNIAGSWFMRTARTTDTGLVSQILYTGSSQPLGTNTAWRANGSPLGIRPCFYLSEDFFKNCKLEYAGKTVQDEIKDICNTELYTDEELEAAFSVPTAENIEIKGELVTGETLEAVYDYKGIYPEDGADYIWYFSGEQYGEYEIIEGASGKTFVLTEAQADKYIRVSVTPRSTSPFVPVGKEQMCEQSYGYVYGSAALSEALRQVKAAGKDNILTKIEEYNILFKVDTDYAGIGVTDQAKDGFSRILSAMEFDSISELREAYKNAAALVRLNLETDKENIGSRIEDEDLGLELTRYKKQSDTSDVADAVYNKAFTDYGRFKESFYKALAVVDVNNNDREDIKEILIYYDEYFDSDLKAISDYRLGIAASEVLKNKYSDFESLNNAVKAAVTASANVKEPETAPGAGKTTTRTGEAAGFKNNGIPSIAYRRDNGLKIETEDGEGIIFSDLDKAPWAAESILYLADRGIAAGYDDGTFRPENTLLREEFVKLAAAAFITDAADVGAGFEDVEENAWYAPYINKAAAKGAVLGISDTEFGIGKTITREDVAVILYRLMPEIEAEPVTDYADRELISDYAKEAVEKMSAAGIINGFDNGCFEPKAEATRAMAAKIICGMLKYMEK